MNQQLEHLFDVSPERFWQIFLSDEEYLRALYAHLKLRIEHRRVEERGEGADLVVERELHFTPDRQLPGALAKVLRGATLVKEYGTFNARQRQLEIRVELPVIHRLVSFGGRYSWEVRDGGGFKRIWRGECNVRLPLVGRKIEEYLLGETRVGLEDTYRFTQDWLARHP